MRIFIALIFVFAMSGCEQFQSFTESPQGQLVAISALQIAGQQAVVHGLKGKDVDRMKAMDIVNSVESRLEMNPPDWDGAYAYIIANVPVEYQLIASSVINVSRAYAQSALDQGEIDRARQGIKAALDGARFGLAISQNN